MAPRKRRSRTNTTSTRSSRSCSRAPWTEAEDALLGDYLLEILLSTEEWSEADQRFFVGFVQEQLAEQLGRKRTQADVLARLQLINGWLHEGGKPCLQWLRVPAAEELLQSMRAAARTAAKAESATRATWEQGQTAH